LDVQTCLGRQITKKKKKTAYITQPQYFSERDYFPQALGMGARREDHSFLAVDFFALLHRVT